MSKSPSFVILAAGKGTRLGGSLPKPLTALPDGRSILQQQLDNIETIFGAKALGRTTVVVGHKAEVVSEHLPKRVNIVYNEAYDSSNTAHSLYRGLAHSKSEGSVIWFNGDVVFSPLILGRIGEELAFRNFMAVVPGLCGEEEMKYSLSEGRIVRVSKTNSRGLGEAVGINQISASHQDIFLKALRRQKPQAYFEAAIQDTIDLGIDWYPLDTTGLHALEVDFSEDLERVNDFFLNRAIDSMKIS